MLYEKIRVFVEWIYKLSKNVKQILKVLIS